MTDQITVTRLRDRCLLAHLEVRQWNPRAGDKSATREVADAHGAEETALSVRKALLRKGGALKDVSGAAAMARQTVLNLTVPWDAAGWRLLRNELFLPLRNEVHRIKADFERGVRNFVLAYDDERRDAQKMLGSLYDESLYPAPEDMARRFSMRFEFRPLPDKSHLQSDLADEIQREVIASLESGFEARMVDVKRDLWERIYQALADENAGMIARLSRYEVDPETGKVLKTFRDSAVESVRALADLLPALNVADDPELERMRVAMLDELCQFDADVLRDEDEVRAHVIEKAEAIRDRAREQADALADMLS